MDILKTPDVRKVCHDIRGCMQGLRLCLSALETPMTTDERLEFVQDIVNAADRMSGLMDRLDGVLQDEPPVGGRSQHDSAGNALQY